jgi:pimeloyl-ACP methyl ester carboxylesterase
MRCLLIIISLFSGSIVNAQSDSAKSYQTDSGYYSSFDHTKIYYESKGAGPAVLLVHGFIVNSTSWKRTPLLDNLVKNGFRVITVDLRGNGKSGKPGNEGGYANDAEAKDLMGLISYLKIKKYDVVGYSRGSIITARLLVLDKRVGKAVLGGMGTGFTDPQWPRRIMFYEALSGKPVKELEGVMNYVKQQGLDTMALAYMQKYQPSTSPAELGKLKNQVLIISGDQDSDNGSAAELAKMFSSATTANVPGDHNHAAGTPEFSEKVVAFLKQRGN